MAATLIRHIQIRNQGVYNDTITPNATNFETSPTTLRDDVNNLVSAIKNLKGASNNWYDDFDGSADNLRPVSTLGTDLATVEDKRFLFRNQLINDVTVGAGNNYVILGAGEIPSAPYDVAAIVTTTVGSVAAFHAGTFGTHSLDEIAGPNALNPLNLVTIRDANTFDSITSGGREVFALFQYEQNVDGGSITTTTPNRVQLSFVRSNAGGTDLEAVPVADIEGRVINYANPVRVAYLNIPEWAFITGLFVDQAAATDVTLTNAIANQSGEAPQNQNIDVAVASTFSWDFLAGSGGSSIANFANNAGVATLTLGSAGTAVTTVAGATLDINVTNPVTIASSLVVEDGGNPDVRIAGAAGAGTIDTATGALSLVGASGLNATATTGNVAITSTAAAVTIDGAGLVEINSSGAAINIGNDADAFAINVGTGAAARSITVGNATGATSVNLDSGTGGFTFDSTVGGAAAFATVTTSGSDGDSVSWFVSDLDPSAGAGVAAPVGSMLWRDQGGGGTVGEAWIKTGSADTAWEQVRTGTAGADTLQTAYEAGNTITTSLAEGDVTITGTEDLVISTSDLLVDTTASISLDADAASNFTVAGANLTLETTGSAGSVLINAAVGITGTAANATNAAANNILFFAGSSTGGNNGGGNVGLFAGDGFGTGNGGAFQFDAGDSGAGATGDGGSFVINGGNALSTDGNGGGLVFTGGSGTGTANAGGATLQGGSNTSGSGSGGIVSLQGGLSTSGNGGGVSIIAGNGGANAGAVFIQAGEGIGTANGGAASLFGGNGGATSGNAGSVTVSGGSSTEGDGGNVTIVGTAANGAGNDNGGSVFLESNLGTGTGVAGSVYVRAPNLAGVTQEYKLMELDNRGTGTGGGESVGLYTGTDAPTHTAETGSLFMRDSGTGGDLYINTSSGGSGTTWSTVATSTSVTLQTAYENGNTIVTDVGNGAFDVSGTQAISLDAGAASNFTVTGGNLVLETVTSGSVDVNSAAAVTIDSTTGMSLTSGGTASFQSAGAMSILTQTNTGSDITIAAAGNNAGVGGDLLMSSGNGSGANAGGVITLTAGAGGLTGVGGDITVTAGAGGSTSGNGGNLTLQAGLPVDGNGGIAALIGRNGVGTDRDGGSVGLVGGDSTGTGDAGSVSGLAGTGTSTGAGGDIVMTAGDGNRAGNVDLTAGNGLSAAGGNLNFNAGNGAGAGNGGGTVTINSGGAAEGNGGDISLVASAGTGTNRDGGDIFLSSGLNTGTGAAGTIQLRTPANIAVGQSWQVAQLNNRGTGTGGGEVMGLYTGTAAPTHTAPTGSLFLFDNNSTGRVYVNVSAGGSGTTWQELTTAASTASRLFFQDTVASAVSAGNDLTGADMTGGVLPTKPASITDSATFAQYAEVYINGVLQFNGAANDVDYSGTGTNIALVLASVSIGDVVTIIYFNNI